MGKWLRRAASGDPDPGIGRSAGTASLPVLYVSKAARRTMKLSWCARLAVGAVSSGRGWPRPAMRDGQMNLCHGLCVNSCDRWLLSLSSTPAVAVAEAMKLRTSLPRPVSSGESTRSALTFTLQFVAEAGAWPSTSGDDAGRDCKPLAEGPADPPQDPRRRLSASAARTWGCSYCSRVTPSR